METSSIGVRELKNGATRIIRAVRESRAEYIVTVHGKPAAILRPITPEDEKRARDARAAAFIAELQGLALEIAPPPGAKTLRQQLEDDRGEA